MRHLLPACRCHEAACALLTTFLGTALAPDAAAQFLRQMPSRHFDAILGSHRHAADVDGDGDIDLIATDGVSVQVFENRGQMRFSEVGSASFPNVATEHIALLDLNADGRLDVVSATGSAAGPAIRAHVWAGGGAYRDESWRLPPDVNPRVLLSGDADGDGDQDLIVVDGPRSTLNVLTNDGTGRFTLSPLSQPVANPGRGWAAELTGDRAVDLVLTAGEQVQTMRNDGRGNFVAASLPVRMATEVVAADFDRDGDVDLAATSSGDLAPLYLLDNNGTGVFTSSPQRLPAPRETNAYGLAALDADNDGDTDLVLGTSNRNSELLLNGGGVFARPTTARIPASLVVGQMLPADLDGNGAVDMVVTAASGAEIWINVGGRFTALDPPALPARLQAFADLNGDGDVDGVGLGIQQIITTRNDGSGRFEVDRIIPLAGAADVVLAGDLDGDRDNDLLLFLDRYTANGRWQAFSNDGRGNLTAGASFVVGASSLEDGVLIDLDADGDADLLRHDGRALESAPAGFIARAFAATTQTFGRATAIDVDGDRLPEVLLNQNGTIRAFANRGGFAVAALSNFVVNPGLASIVIPSLARDGTLRLWITTASPVPTLSLHVFTGTAFQLVASTPLQDPAVDAHVIEIGFNTTQHCLLTFGNSGSGTTRAYDLLLNDRTAQTLIGDPRSIAQVVDLDQNGFADLINPANEIWWNGERAHAPFGALLGSLYQVEFSPNPIVAALVGTRTTKVATPLGFLRVDPAGAVVLALTAPQISFQVPNVAALRGLEIAVQGLDNTMVLTNLERRIIR